MSEADAHAISALEFNGLILSLRHSRKSLFIYVSQQRERNKERKRSSVSKK